MATLLTVNSLSEDENDLMGRIVAAMSRRRRQDERLNAYYEGWQRVDQLGIAVPPELRRFETVVNWCRVAVDEVERRQDIKSIYLPDETESSKDLQRGWESNDLNSSVPVMLKEKLIFGRAYMTVGSNEDDEDSPLITVESPREMGCIVDQRRRRMRAALRQYKDWDDTRRRTLYLPNSTVWLEAGRNGWRVEDRDDHDLDRPPVVLFLNRRRLGDWWGTSEMADVIPLVDAAVRSLTNLQIAGETHSVPPKYALGIAMGDFVDARTKKPLTTWESYFTSFMASQNKDATIGQLPGTDLDNFHKTINHYAHLVASTTGLPLRYLGQQAVNPAAEGAIRAEEARFVKNVERKEVDDGDALGWVMGVYDRIRTGAWRDASRIQVEWHDPGTPTAAQRADAIQKLAGGVPILSREGAWDELGWDEPRKERERAYFEAQNRDPQMEDLSKRVEIIGKQATAWGTFIRGGATDKAASEATGLPPIEHTGLLPVTVRDPEDQAPTPPNGARPTEGS